MTIKNTIITALVSFLLGLALAFLIKGAKQPVLEPLTERVDTLSVRDTILEIKPEIEAEKPEKVITITLWKEVMDSTAISQRDSVLNILGIVLRERDSLQLILTRVQREYGNENYHAWVSGIDPELDSIKVFPTTTYVNKYIKQPVKYKPKFTFGVQGGIGVIIPFSSGKPDAGGYVGLGVQYNF